MNTLPCPTLELAKVLIARPSITPEDAGCQALLATRLQNLGFTIQSLPFEDVHNLWAIRHQNPGPLLVFAGHTDVVPPGNLEAWHSPPFTPTIAAGMLRGRGAADMKGNLAAMITACERFVQQYPDYPGGIAFLITSDEEGPAQNGTVKIIDYLHSTGITIDYCLVGEPSSEQSVGDVLKNGRRGSLCGHLTIIGKQGHVAYPEKANNPIHRAFAPLAALSEMTWDRGNTFFPPTTFQIANIQAGTGASNVIPETLECQFNIRFNTESTPESLVKKIHALLQTHDIQYELHTTVSGHPFLTPPGVLVSACTKAIEEILQITPRLSTSGGTSDARFIALTGAEVIELGCCNASIHAVNESVRIEDLIALSTVYERVLELLLLSPSPLKNGIDG